MLLGDRAVAADCLDTTDALSGENSSTRWEKRADGVRLTWTVQLKQDIKRRLFFKAGCAPPESVRFAFKSIPFKPVCCHAPIPSMSGMKRMSQQMLPAIIR